MAAPAAAGTPQQALTHLPGGVVVGTGLPHPPFGPGSGEAEPLVRGGGSVEAGGPGVGDMARCLCQVLAPPNWGESLGFVFFSFLPGAINAVS